MKVAEAEEEGRRRKKIAAGKQVSSSTHYSIPTVYSTAPCLQAKEKLLSETKESISRHRKEQSRYTSNK